ncbi:MAG: hypothetical protein QXX25_02105 [Thermofilaceae archaeon]
MRGAFVVAAALTLGSGIGLILGDFVSPANPDVGNLPVIVQPVVFSILIVFAHAVKPRSEYWASALALSVASAMTAAALRIAATALRMMGTPSASLPQLLTSLSYPQSVFDQSMIVLLGLSLVLSLGQMLLTEGFVRLFSPLWLGVEALPTSISLPSRVNLKEYAIGAPLGALLAWADLGNGPFSPRVVPWAFTLLQALILPASTSITLSTHLLLQHVLAGFSEPTIEMLFSIRTGVQLGLVASTAAAVILLYVVRGATLYPKKMASLAVSMLGILLLLLGYIVVGTVYAVYLLLNTVVMLLLTIFVVIRLEGGTFVVLHPAHPLMPELLQLAWISLTIFSEKVLSLQNVEPLMNLVLHPSLILTLVVLTLWDCKLVGSVSSATLLPLSLGMPLLLLLARAATLQGDYASLSRFTDWSLRLQKVSTLPPVNAILMVIVAIIVAVITFLTYYTPLTSSWLRYFKLTLDPNGLMFAYSIGQVLPAEPLVIGILILLVVLNLIRVYLVTLGRWSRAKSYLYGTNVAYGIASIVLLYRRFLK